eukprot:8841494-Heterocapsa_arctica.AAC.1
MHSRPHKYQAVDVEDVVARSCPTCRRFHGSFTQIGTARIRFATRAESRSRNSPAARTHAGADVQSVGVRR